MDLTGCILWSFVVWFDFNQERSQHIDDADPNPDQRTFEALELLIMKVHAAGGHVHIWLGAMRVGIKLLGNGV